MVRLSLLTCLICLGTGAAPAQDAGYPGSLSEADGKRIIELFKDSDKALGDSATRFAHFKDLIRPMPLGADLEDAPGAVPGISSLTIQSARGTDSVFDLNFSTLAAADSFRDQVSAAFGAPDPACTNATEAHWSPREGLSLRLQITDFKGAAGATFALRGADPLDANCGRSSSGKDRLVDVEKSTAFFKRLSVEPPPFNDPEKMAEWVKPYGTGESSTVECQTDIYMPETAHLPGLDTLMVTLRTCPPGPESRPSGISIFAGTTDMYALDRLRQALAAAYGEKDAACSNGERSVWKVKDNLTVVLVPMFTTNGLLIYDAPTTIMGDCKPT